MISIESLIITHLLHDVEYMRKVSPHLVLEYFADPQERLIVQHILEFVNTYNACPSVEAIIVLIQKEEGLKDTEYQKIVAILDECREKTDTNADFLIEQTESFCKEKALFNAIVKSIHIHEGKEKKEGKGAIPQMIQDALSVGFDTRIGHDYIRDAEARHDFYTKVENRIPCDIKMLNVITRGGTPRKTLNLILGGIHVGKTMVMCHLASAYKKLGFNVLYITLEMSEEMISERIDANYMNVEIDELATMPKDVFMKKIEKINDRSVGRLIVREMPEGSTVGHIRALLTELKTMENMVPDVVFVDYINICGTASVKTRDNTNTFMKSVIQEFRSLTKERNFVMWSAAQLTRSGMTSSDAGMEDTAEAVSIPATADMMLTIFRSEELDRLGQLLVTQLKNRNRDKAKNTRFVIGCDPAKARLYDVEQSAQRDVVSTGRSDPNTKQYTLSNGSKDFSGIKVGS